MTLHHENDPVQLPIDGILDLHTFQPREVKDLIPDYIHECLDRNIHRVRIIHGKGTGTLKQIVHSVLKKMPEVLSFHLAHEDRSGWGATIVNLREK